MFQNPEQGLQVYKAEFQALITRRRAIEIEHQRTHKPGGYNPRESEDLLVRVSRLAGMAEALGLSPKEVYDAEEECKFALVSEATGG